MSVPERSKRRRGRWGLAASQQRPASKKAWCLAVGLRTLIALSVLVPTLSSALVHWPAGPIVEKALAIVALGLFGFHSVNARTRVRLRHWRVEGLARKLYAELAIGCAVPIAIVLAAVYLPPTWETLLAIGIVFGLAHSFYEPLEETIRSMVTKAGLRQGTSRFAERKLFRVVDIKDPVSEIAKREHGPGLQRFLAFWLKPSWRPLLSRTRTVILYIMLGSCCAACGAALDVGVHAPPAHHAKSHKGSSAQKPDDQPVAGTAVVQEEAGDDTTVVASESWEAACRHLPGYGAPAWARADLNALYLGGIRLNATKPPGTAGGCTGKAVVKEDGAFVYTIGKNLQGETLSIALDSLEFGPAIFLAPAAQRVIALIEHGWSPLGGLPTMPVAGGDVAAILTEQGTIALVRSETHLPNRPDVATPYTELPPAAASAWSGAMHELNRWLWPLPPQTSNGVEVFPLALDAGGKERVFSIVYDPGSGAAQRDQYRYQLPAHQLDQGELERHVRSAE
jgi:hypothetical protein